MANEEVYLAFDLGASSGRAMLGRVGPDDRVSLEEVHRFPNGPVRRDGGVFWDIEGLFAHMCHGLKLVAQRGVAPLSIGVDTWGVDFALLGKDGRLLDEPRCYRDGRNVGVSRRVVERIGEARLLGRTGSMFQDHSSLCQFVAMKECTPRLLEKAEKLLFIPDLLRHWLCGCVDSDCTIASTSQMYDVPQGEWAREILDELLLPWSILPTVRVGSHIAGALSEQLRRDAGLPSVPVVLGGGHDTGAAFGICRTGDVPSDDLAVISSGTWSLLGVFVDSHLPPGTLDGRKFGYEANPDGSLRITCNLTGGWLLERCRDVWSADGHDVSYERLIQLAKASAGTVGASAIVDPQSDGFMRPENMCQAIDDYCRQSGQPCPREIGEYSHVVFNSLADSYAGAIIDLRKRTGKPLGHLLVVGGMSRNAYLNELTRQKAGARLLLGPSEATAIGNVALQRWAVHGRYRPVVPS